jgi:NAD dependent epimerase/dehydratase family enzyme
MISWIHIDDLCRMYIAGIENENMHGAYNAVAPNPVANKTLTLALAKQMRGKAFVTIHVPSVVLKIILGEMSIEVLKSATVSSGKIESTGFTFRFPTINEGLKELLER